MAKHCIYRFYAELKDYTPKIWRRFEINGEKTMADIAYALMIMFEMRGSHGFSIYMNTWEYFRDLLKQLQPSAPIPSKEADFGDNIQKITRFKLLDQYSVVAENEKVFPADTTLLGGLRLMNGWHGVLAYDPGQRWEVELRLESGECYDDISIAGYPRVLEGEGFGIIEDVGGTKGLARLAEAFSKGKGKEYQKYCEWLGVTKLDLSSFDREEMNLRLKKLLKVYRDSYEKKIPPSAKSQALLLRKGQGKPGK